MIGIIKVIKRSSIKMTEPEALFVTFSYDAAIVSVVRNIQGRYYHNPTIGWEVPLHKIGELVAKFGDELEIASDIDVDYKVTSGNLDTEANFVVGKLYKAFLTKALSEVPAYFFEVAASSTGKYHPAYALGEGGLIRHTKAAVHIAMTLFSNVALCPPGIYTQDVKDEIIIALVLHDSIKHGRPKEAYTSYEHPNLAADFVINIASMSKILNSETAEFIASLIRCHMGPWNKNKQGDEILPTPVTEFEKFVHLCDYLASRKSLEVKFDDTNNVCT